MATYDADQVVLRIGGRPTRIGPDGFLVFDRAREREERVKARARVVVRELAAYACRLPAGALSARYWRRRPKGSPARKRLDSARSLSGEGGIFWAVALMVAEQEVALAEIIERTTIAAAVFGNAWPSYAAAHQAPAEPAGAYRCAMCGGVFETDWSDEEAKAEALAKGIDPARTGVVCDDCYKRTPWGGG